jgi:hypothetical protein
MNYLIKVVVSSSIIMLSFSLSGQQDVPYSVSSRIFSPFFNNPAIVGSKDYTSVDFVAIFQGNAHSQLVNFNTRLKKKQATYFPNKPFKTFRNIGLGGALLNDKIGGSHNLGFIAAAAYHYPVNKQNLSFFSVGASVKGYYNNQLKDVRPSTDFGIYYYTPTIVSGFSVINLASRASSTDSSSANAPPLLRNYNFMGGYKFILSRRQHIVLEPSLYVEFSDSTKGQIEKSLKPMVKIYLENFSVGTFLNDYKKLSFFFQYKFPQFYIASYIEFPNSSFYLKSSSPTIEFSFGLNFPRFNGLSHW